MSRECDSRVPMRIEYQVHVGIHSHWTEYTGMKDHMPVNSEYKTMSGS
jgi:hypothetical protein